MPVTTTTTTNPRDDDQIDDQQATEHDTSQRQIHGLLASYQDDQINECVRSALRGKKRVHYKCLDSVANLLALGTSVGAIYLFRLTNVTHSTCKLALVIPCDQGPIEVIKFLPNDQTNGLLVAIGTARGSIVIFQLEFSQTQSIGAQEIYRAEKLTKSETIGIKFIQPDQDLLDPCQPYTKLYICDEKCRIFVLDSNSIYPSFPLLYNNKPTPVLDVLESEIHQIFVHRSSLLLSTDERTQVFKEYSTRPEPIGKTKRKRGFYGACFFNANYKPARMQQQPNNNRIAASQQTIYSSTASLADLDNLVIFVARPKFSLWQVNYKRQVLFTHKFESPIKSTPPARIVPLHNEPLSEVKDENSDEIENMEDKPDVIVDCFVHNQTDPIDHQIKTDHFEMLLPMFSSTLGNLLLSYTRHEIFIMDPTSARLILWHPYEKAIHQVCCNENEIFVLFESGKRSFQVERIVLLAPTQFVLELHRLNRHLSLMAFINLFGEQFRLLMALPLSGPGTLTSEGGLLRNIVWSTWHESTQQQAADVNFVVTYESFKSLVEEIIDESAQFKQTIANPTDSQILLTASNDNIERLFMEPYASMVSLDISIANLHTNHVVLFSQEALNRQQSLAKLSQSILNLSQLRRTGSARLSLLNLGEKDHENSGGNAKSQHAGMELNPNSRFYDKKVYVEPLISKRQSKQPEIVAETVVQEADLGEVVEALDERDAEADELAVKENEEMKEIDDYLGGTVCPECRWPRPRAHLKPMRRDQQIQFSWLQENLLPNFEENIDQIEKCAFQNGLWHLVLRCLAFRNQLDEYIICCIMLDDVRLLNMEKFVVIKRSEGEFINLVFKQLEHKLDFHDEINNRTAHSSPSSESDDKQIYLKDLSTACLKCRHVCEAGERSQQDSNSNQSDGEEAKSDSNQSKPDTESNGEEDDISFNLVNLFKRIMLRRSADIKRAVETLLLYSKLLERSKIPASFYLQMLGNQCSVLRRTRLKVV